MKGLVALRARHLDGFGERGLDLSRSRHAPDLPESARPVASRPGVALSETPQE